MEKNIEIVSMVDFLVKRESELNSLQQELERKTNLLESTQRDRNYYQKQAPTYWFDRLIGIFLR